MILNSKIPEGPLEDKWKKYKSSVPLVSPANKRRIEIANYYCENIKNDKIILSVKYHSDPLSHVYHLFVVRTKDRNHLKEYLNENGIGSDIHYPIPPHKQMAYKEWSNHSYPISEKIHESVLSIPAGLHLSDGDVEKITAVLNRY